jgi:6-phosphogluconolactonase
MERSVTGKERVGVSLSMVKVRKILIFDDRESAADYIITRWSELAVKSVRQRGVFSVALSGGKTPAVLFDRLSLSEKTFVWDKTHIFFSDERFVPANSPESNYNFVQKHLISRVGVLQRNVHHVITRDVSLEGAARIYDDALRKFFKEGLPRFDLILLGVGPDGHTASVFPGREDHQDRQHLAIPVIAETFPPERISLTVQVINNARHVIMFATGRSKAKIIQEVVEQRNAALPAARVIPHAGELTYVLDSAAASFLQQANTGTHSFKA